MHSALVIGGAGFLGSHVVQQLAADSDYRVAVFDLHEPNSESRVEGVVYMTGSIVDATSITNAVREIEPLVVLHTASPVHGLSEEIYYDVNEKGTRNVISACREAGVKKLIYTSSTGVVWTGADFNGISETQIGFPSQGYDAYHHTKGLGERLILAAQGRDEMQTVILRPCGMTGERDKQLMWRLAEVYSKKQHNIQIGNNDNLVDYAYAGNVAHAHVLACNKLISDPESVSGETFFITNGEPLPQWDFSRMVWKELGDDGKSRIFRIPRLIGLLMATIAEAFCRVTGTSTQFTKFSVRFVTGTQWYNINKARGILGYSPPVALEEGIRRTVKWWKETGSAQHELQIREGR
ncbi:sterol-4-alpha-carboxylate 3-dehydrogenase [Mycena crocata]|nr:sterol-4-alpha-carboxylate 3-dehydrogenase [Mycena crocata]